MVVQPVHCKHPFLSTRVKVYSHDIGTTCQSLHANNCLMSSNRSDVDSGAAGGCLGSRDMATTRFQDLDLRIGPRAGYIFCHQGSCEHLVVVRDIRRIHPVDGGDPRFMGSYPYLTGQVCLACTAETAAQRSLLDGNKLLTD